MIMTSSVGSAENSFQSPIHLARIPDGEPKVLVVALEAERRELTAELFLKAGFSVQEAPAAAIAWDPDNDTVFDLIVLDGQMADGGALAVCRQLMESQEAPIMILSDSTDVVDRVVALEVGADDLLGRPFDGRELLARARALLRRSAPKRQAAPAPNGSNDGALHLATRILTGPSGSRVVLPQSLMAVLQVLVARPGELVSVDEILDLLGGGVPKTYFRSTIARLRKELARAGFQPSLLMSIRGGGYMLSPKLQIQIRSD